MRPVEELGADEARALCGLVFDLDDTVLSGGLLSEAAFQALFRLKEGGLSLCACTGRPASWGAVIARQWPIDLACCENGAIAFARRGSKVEAIDRLEPLDRLERSMRLQKIRAELGRRFPDVPAVDDGWQRRTDLAFDIGETASVPPARVAELQSAAAELGARTFVSSIHLHLTLDGDDKASGVIRAIGRALGQDPSAALQRFAFVGDSGNDEPCFSAFRLTFAVANVRPHLAMLSVPPRFVSESEQGAGFCEIAALLVHRRGQPS